MPRIRFGGFLAGVDIFDASLFALTSNEVELMDPQQRLLLEASWELLQGVAQKKPGGSHGVSSIKGGMHGSVSAPADAPPRDTAVYVGIQQMEYGTLASRHIRAMGAFAATGTPFSVAAGRLSFTYGFSGPAVSVDTACSSALVGVHMAAHHLGGRGGEALSAGVNLMLAEHTTAAAQSAGMLTRDGHCKTLDAAADGYVRAETCIMLHLLASLPNQQEAAGRETKQANCVMLRGTFVNQDGRSSSLTAPNGPAQQSVLRGALEAARLRPRDIMGLEMHGTGWWWDSACECVCVCGLGGWGLGGRWMGRIMVPLQLCKCFAYHQMI